MDQLIPGLAALVEAFRDVFHPQVFSTFQALIAGWIVCPRDVGDYEADFRRIPFPFPIGR